MVNQISWMAVKTSRHQVIRAWVGRERKRQEKTHFKNETVGLSMYMCHHPGSFPLKILPMTLGRSLHLSKIMFLIH